MRISQLARRVLGLAIGAALLGAASGAAWAEAAPKTTSGGHKLQKGDFVAVCGDSITEQKMYSVYIQDYLLMCKPAGELRMMQFGWSGEVAPGFLNKMPTQALKFPVTIATTCYGMNDGGYSPMTPDKAERYRKAMQGIIDNYKKHGVRYVVVGSPGAVDFDFFLRADPTDPEKKRKIPRADMYNKTLSEMRDIARELAEKNGCAFANVHDAMIDAMKGAKAKYGPKYNVCGSDGFHPGPNGQLCMAYAFLKGLGIDGHIGTIKVDLGGNKAEATDGHKVLGAAGGKVEVESEKYPFCFYGDPTSPGSTSGIVEFLPFNQDLNRFMLVVNNAGAAKVKITWGKNTKEFDAAQLEKGINLAAEFVADNPFSEPFKKVEAVIKAQQNAETPLVKKTLNDLPKAKDKEAAAKAAEAEMKKAKEMFDASAAAAKQPVKHTIVIEAVK